jgi:hypothetical protein
MKHNVEKLDITRPVYDLDTGVEARYICSSLDTDCRSHEGTKHLYHFSNKSSETATTVECDEYGYYVYGNINENGYMRAGRLVNKDHAVDSVDCKSVLRGKEIQRYIDLKMPNDCCGAYQ